MTETPEPQLLTLRERKAHFIEQLRERWDAEIAPVVPSHISEGKLTGLMSAAFTSTPMLLHCHPLTMLESLIEMFRLGLTPNSSALGHGWILPYKDAEIQKASNGQSTHRAAAIIGYKGWITLANQQGNIEFVDAGPVYRKDVEAGRVRIGKADDKFYAEYEEDLLDDGTGREDSDIVGAYCHMKGLDGRSALVWLPRYKLDKLEPKRGGRGTWASNSKFPTRYPGMVRKTAIRAIFNQGLWPIETEQLRDALTHEQKIDDLDRKSAVELPEDESRSRTEQLLEDITGETEQDPPGPDFTGVTPEEAAQLDIEEASKEAESS